MDVKVRKGIRAGVLLGIAGWLAIVGLAATTVWLLR